MSYLVYDEKVNMTLAVLSDIAIAQCVVRLYEDLGIHAKLRTHNIVSCATVDFGSKPIYMFEI